MSSGESQAKHLMNGFHLVVLADRVACRLVSANLHYIYNYHLCVPCGHICSVRVQFGGGGGQWRRQLP